MKTHIFVSTYDFSLNKNWSEWVFQLHIDTLLFMLPHFKTNKYSHEALKIVQFKYVCCPCIGAESCNVLTISTLPSTCKVIKNVFYENKNN